MAQIVWLLIKALFPLLGLLFLMSLVPKLSMSPISVGQLTDMNCFVVFDDTSFFVHDRRDTGTLGIGHCRRRFPG